MADFGSQTMDEHGPRQQDDVPNPNVYMPSPDEEALVKRVHGLFRKAKKHKERYDRKWPDWYRMFRGKQWPDQRPSWRHSEVINLIFQAAQSQVPIETDSRPKFTFLPQEPEDTEFSAIINETADAEWENNNWLMTLTEVGWDKWIYSAGLSSMWYDHEANNGAGKIRYDSKDPFYCFPDPNARDVNVDSEFFIYAEPMDVKLAKKKWPKKAKFIRSDAQDIHGANRSEVSPVRLVSAVDQRAIYESSNPEDMASKEQVLVITAWLHEDEVEEKEENGEYIQRRRYPNGRKVVVINNIVHEDGEFENDYGEIPFERCQNYILPREFWGVSDIEPLEGPQKLFNKVVCYALDVLTLMGNPIWVVPMTSGVDTDALFNRPGDVIEPADAESAAGVRRVEGVQLQPWVLQLVDKLRSWFDQVAGSQDITRGVNPTGVTAMGAIEALQEAAQTRSRQKMRSIDAYMKQVARHWLMLVMKHYDAPRMFRLLNNDAVKKYFKMHIIDGQDQEGNPVKVARIQNYVMNGDQWSPTAPRDVPIKGELDVRASTSSGLPFAKAEREQRLTKWFELGIIDAQEVLIASEYPRAQEVLARLKAKEEQQMAMQQQAQMQQPAPQGA